MSFTCVCTYVACLMLRGTNADQRHWKKRRRNGFNIFGTAPEPFFGLRRCTRWKLIFSIQTVLWQFHLFSAAKPLKMRLSHTLQHWISNIVSFNSLFSVDMASTLSASHWLLIWVLFFFSSYNILIWDWLNSRLDFGYSMSLWSISNITSFLFIDSSTLTSILVVSSSVSVDQYLLGCFCGRLMMHSLLKQS